MIRLSSDYMSTAKFPLGQIVATPGVSKFSAVLMRIRLAILPVIQKATGATFAQRTVI